MLVALPPRRAGWPASTSATGTSGWRSPTAAATSSPRSDALDVDDARRRRPRLAAADGARRPAPPPGSTAATCTASGCACPRPLDRRSARISTGILPGWRDLSPGDELDRRLGVAGLRRQRRQPRRARRARATAPPAGSADVVYVKVASGVGAGIVLGGRLHRGATGIAGEIGHVQVGEDGEVCRCGNRGCLETAGRGARACCALLQPAYDEELTSSGSSSSTPRATPAYAGCSATPAAPSAARWPTSATASTPRRSSSAARSATSPSLVDGVRAAVDRYAQPDTAAAVGVVAGELGDRAEVIGAVSLAVAMVTAGD